MHFEAHDPLQMLVTDGTPVYTNQVYHNAPTPTILTSDSLCCPVLACSLQYPGLGTVSYEEAVVVGPGWATVITAGATLTMRLQQGSDHLHGCLGGLASLQAQSEAV